MLNVGHLYSDIKVYLFLCVCAYVYYTERIWCIRTYIVVYILPLAVSEVHYIDLLQKLYAVVRTLVLTPLPWQ